MRAPKPPRPVEGEDYYLEAGRVVFTEAYHLKRGYCCNSKCRHCPYRGSAQTAPGGEPGPRALELEASPLCETVQIVMPKLRPR